MADGIANNVGQRFRNCIQQALVEIRLLTSDGELHLLSAPFCGIVDYARKAPEQLFDWHHANLHYRALQIIQHSRLKSHCIGEARA